VLGVALLPPLMVANLLGPTATGRVGEPFERPQTLSAVQNEYRLLAGSSRLDLSDVDFAQQPTAVTASVGMGELVVVVPAEARVEVDAELRAGELDLFGEETGGTNLRRVVVQEGVEGGGRLELDIDGGVGTVAVLRGAERSPS
jgi:cell wall-active antibiotic response 4TMS protein YvqF